MSLCPSASRKKVLCLPRSTAARLTGVVSGTAQLKHEVRAQTSPGNSDVVATELANRVVGDTGCGVDLGTTPGEDAEPSFMLDGLCVGFSKSVFTRQTVR